ncbi:MAG: LysM peptidoglycan-binding domain-containing protein [Ruminococcaceae bacterium]|nr:LysM peptidoglycan-binding domain-containing protein [Oscillospiraceae bacterium]
MKHRILSLSLLLALLLASTLPAFAAEDPIVIYYTNDVHSYIDNARDDAAGLTYSRVAAWKAATPGALLLDAGDHLQGTAYGGLDQGVTITALMNAAGYDAATLGNHEFDYGMAGCLAAIDRADFPYLSCNFRHEAAGIPGDTVLEPFALYECGGKTVAVLGITTPETITSSAPSYFQDEEGNFIYGIDGGSDGRALYAAVQSAIDAARASGADYVIALGHLGVDPSSGPWTSRNVIANTSGLDAFLDGHSHTTIEEEFVTDRDGCPVLLTQTGSYLNAVGKLTISTDGRLSAELLSGEDLTALSPDAEVQTLEDAWIAEIEDRLGQVIGRAEITLDNFDADGTRLVRRQSTNTGDFAADALYALFDEMDMEVDLAVMNGGGVRNGTVTGDLTYLTCKEIHTFGNVACLLRVTGQQILDMLEWGSKGLNAEGTAENGSLLHVSGARYTLDLSRPSTVQSDENDIWTGPPTGKYRVQDVWIYDRDSGEYLPLDPDATYHLAGYNYTLRDLGGGFNMLKDAVNVLDYVMEDYMVLANYIKTFPVDPDTGLPTLSAGCGYDDIHGSGRITLLQEPHAEAEPAAPTEYLVRPGDSLWKIAAAHYGDGNAWRILYDANCSEIASPGLIYAGQTLILPAA